MPHSLAMTAHRTAIAIVVNDEAMQWGGNRVHVVALVAFSASGRSSFQHVFDQFVEVFSDHRDVQAIMRASGSHGSFIEEARARHGHLTGVSAARAGRRRSVRPVRTPRRPGSRRRGVARAQGRRA
ncbi:hypothetical protein [Clavibacter tessellarius]|uniref:hypothetical protein n=1 Tax=Clavibacter tessellarius TaxID=31965 RepID=UPI0032476A14